MGVLLAKWAPLADHRAGYRVGLIGPLLTLRFESGLGALRGLELRVMLTQYDLTRGHLWPFVPLSMGWHLDSRADSLCVGCTNRLHRAQSMRCAALGSAPFAAAPLFTNQLVHGWRLPHLAREMLCERP